MTERNAGGLIHCYRQGRTNEPQVEKAVRLAEANPELRQRLDEQKRFDADAGNAVRAIQPPDDLAARLQARRATAGVPGGKRRRTPGALPAILAVAIGGLVILCWLAYLRMEQEKRFPGREAVAQMLRSMSSAGPFDLEPITHTTGQLGDWFYMRGFDDFSVPAEVAALPAVGSRVIRQDGKPIAHVSIPHPDSAVAVFRASDFSVQLPATAAWQEVGVEGASAVIRQRGDTCTLMSFRGGNEAMRKFLDSVAKSHP